MKKRIAVVPGDGAGIEVIREAVKVLRALGPAASHELELTEFDWGAERFLRDGVSLPEGALEMLERDFDAILLGALGDPRLPDNKYAMEILFGFRFGLDLYANIRPVKLLHPSLNPLQKPERIDFVIYRENTEGLYARLGGTFKQGTRDEVGIQQDLNTWKGVERIMRFAFDCARGHGRKRLVMCDKSNALPHAHGVWQRVFKTMREEYPDIDSRHIYVDNLAFQMIRDPSQFEVIVTCNMFGDILSDEGAALVGGLGVTPSANVNPERVSMFEPVHGSAPDIAGKNLANPVGAVLTAAMMLEHLGMTKEAAVIEEAVRASIAEGKTTRDLGGALGTREVGDWLANRVAAARAHSR
ncbi:MAG TPA: isocitrate/isopropylmalate dehydrogenase family protein [Candidatus Xenobia bacterium]|nr:isocitrate/isopropylmalate dehydrogenase family protein [Candidatus Xenobia bacterium]